MSALIIERAAPMMQLQDLGRFGVAHHGLSQGGPLDLHAHCWANRLLGNPVSCATIEITFGNTLCQLNLIPSFAFASRCDSTGKVGCKFFFTLIHQIISFRP